MSDIIVKWKRKPCTNPISWKEFRDEDLFLCHNCEGSFPWFKYTLGNFLASNGGRIDLENTYKYLNDDEDRGGYQWGCNNCIQHVIWGNKLIIVRNNQGKIVDNKW
jgi:hypothetical protein